MLQGTEALQVGFTTARRNPEVHEQQLRDTKYTPTPIICQQNAITLLSCFADREALSIVLPFAFRFFARDQCRIKIL
jgi:hypothetical protein